MIEERLLAQDIVLNHDYSTPFNTTNKILKLMLQYRLKALLMEDKRIQRLIRHTRKQIKLVEK